MISAVILVKDEEENIQRSIESLNFCGEIIVVDDNSIDKTPAIAKKLGAKVFVRDMNQDFAEQSNFGMRKTKGGWIFFIDADEVVSIDLKNEIVAKTSKNQSIDGFNLRRNDFIWGKWLTHGEVSAFRSTRLVKRDIGEWKRRVHPVFEIKKGKIAELKNTLEHYPHKNITKFINNIDRWSTWHAISNMEEGKTSTVLKIVFWPFFHFIRNFLFRFGYLDGIQGFVFALMMSFHSYLAWSKLWMMQKK